MNLKQDWISKDIFNDSLETSSVSSFPRIKSLIFCVVNMWIALIKDAKDVAIVEIISFFSNVESSGDSRNTM